MTPYSPGQYTRLFKQPALMTGNAVSGYDTPLTPGQEKQFQGWLGQQGEAGKGFQEQENSPTQKTDYDMRGYWQSSGWIPHEAGAHYIDQYKKPNHITNSDQSQYNLTSNGAGGINLMGHWGTGESYTPAPGANIMALQGYMEKAEKGRKLLLPDSTAIKPQ